MRYRPAFPMTALAAALALATANPLSAKKSDIPAGYQGVCVTLGLDMGRMGCIEDSGCYANVDAHLRLGARLSERFGVGLGASLFGDFESDGSALYSLQALCYPFNRKLFALLGACPPPKFRPPSVLRLRLPPCALDLGPAPLLFHSLSLLAHWRSGGNARSLGPSPFFEGLPQPAERDLPVAMLAAGIARRDRDSGRKVRQSDR